MEKTSYEILSAEQTEPGAEVLISNPIPSDAMMDEILDSFNFKKEQVE